MDNAARGTPAGFPRLRRLPLRQARTTGRQRRGFAPTPLTRRGPPLAIRKAQGTGLALTRAKAR